MTMITIIAIKMRLWNKKCSTGIINEVWDQFMLMLQRKPSPCALVAAVFADVHFFQETSVMHL